MVEILRRWYDEVFHSQESELLPILLRDVEARRVLATTMPVERLIEIVTNGWEYVPEPGIGQVLLIPSVVIRPQVHSLDHHEVKIFCYPVADEYMIADRDAAISALTASMFPLIASLDGQAASRPSQCDCWLNQSAHPDSGPRGPAIWVRVE